MSLTYEKNFFIALVITVIFLLIIYTIPLILSIFIGNKSFLGFVYDVNTARNLLGSIVQGLSAFLAIFISLVLVVLQLNASKYTTKVFKLFFYDLRTMVAIFFIISVIFYSIAILANINDKFIFYFGVDFTIILTSATLIIITYYVYSIDKLISPESLANKIFLNTIKSLDSKNVKEVIDGIEQIGDIGKRTVLDGNTQSTLFCISKLKEIGTKYISSDKEIKKVFFEQSKLGDFDDFNESLFNQLGGILNNTIERDNKYVSRKIIYIIFELGMTSLENSSKEDFVRILNELYENFLCSYRDSKKRIYDVIPYHILISYSQLYKMTSDKEQIELGMLIIEKLKMLLRRMIEVNEKEMLNSTWETLKDLHDSTHYVKTEKLTKLWDDVTESRRSGEEQEIIEEKKDKAIDYGKKDDEVKKHINEFFFSSGAYCLYMDMNDLIKILFKYRSKDKLIDIYQNMVKEDSVHEWDPMFLTLGFTSGSPAEQYFKEFHDFLNKK